MFCEQIIIRSLPAFFRVLISLVVELEGNLGVQSDAEVVVHHALLGALSTNTENMQIALLKCDNTLIQEHII